MESRDCRHDKQIHSRDAVGMVADKGLPALGRRVSSPDHILGHARLSDIDAELEQFAMNPWRSPQRIGNTHLADKLVYLRRYGWSATTAPRLPAPVQSEPGTVPFYDGLWLHNRRSVSDRWGQSIQPGKIKRSAVLRVCQDLGCQRSS